MSVFCASCGHANPDHFTSCESCGKSLPYEPNVINSVAQSGSTQVHVFQVNDSLSQSSEETSSFVPQEPLAPTPLYGEPSTEGRALSNGSQTGPISPEDSFDSFQSFVPQTPQAPQTPIIAVNAQQVSPPVVQMGTISTGVRLSKVHAFAGRGIIVTHQSWFISESAATAGDMLKTSFDIFRRRGTLGLRVEPQNLEDHGTQTETRHYLILQRGIATVFLYIAPAGHDLYLSRVTTALTSIDPFRRFLLILFLVLGVLLFIVIPVSIPIWCILLIFFTFSFRNWLRERDFWIYLRKRELNDFQLDDLSLLEHITDDTLKAAAKHNKIDSDKFVPPKDGYQHQRRIRAV